MRDRGPLLIAGVLAIIIIGLYLIDRPTSHPPLDPRSNDPAGTSALIRLVRQLGADTTLDVREISSDTDVALLLWDQLSGGERSRLRSWVRDGGTLVVTDPASPFAPEGGLTFYEQDPAAGGEDEDPIDVDADACDVDPFTDQDLEQLSVWGSPVRFTVGLDDESCFGDGDEAYVVVTPLGDGHIVAFGGSGSVVNKTLAKADNAPAIAGLLAPRESTNVAVMDLRPESTVGGSAGKDLVDVIPTEARRVGAQLAVAFLVYVWWRARRLGKPVTEPQPVKVAASELVAATGTLLERSGSPQHAADVLRADLRRDLVGRLGLPPNLSAETFTQVVSGRTQLDDAQLAAALGPGPVSTDRDLLTVATLIDIVRKEVFEHVGS
jgi:hypothetical protein